MGNTNINLDNELKAKAKEVGINISQLTEYAIKTKLGLQTVNLPTEEGERCKKCGRIETKAIREHTDGLTWLCPDEIWVCDSCLKSAIRKIAVAVG